MGRIGAGTTNPGQPLHVAGKAYISSGNARVWGRIDIIIIQILNQII